MDHIQKNNKKRNGYPFSDLPAPPSLNKIASSPEPPTDEECFALWRKYDMLPNIQRHSLMVAHIATALALQANKVGIEAKTEAIRASALLHDIAKTYCVRHGGSHALLGGAITVAETKHYKIAQGVILHVHWPWELPQGKAICQLPVFVLYADKRVRHDVCVTIDERFEDLFERYGKTQEALASIKQSYIQTQEIEKLLSEQLKWSLHENTFDCWRLVSGKGNIT